MKKSLKKAAALALAAIMAAGVLSSCGEKNTETKTDDTAKSSGKIVMGTNAEFPPFEFVADEGSGTC